jgi:hypothetical protein
VPLSALDSVSPAFEHAKQQTLKPFSIVQWTKLAFVGLMAGELSSGGCNLRGAIPTHTTRSGSDHFLATAIPGVDPALVGALVAVLIASGLVLAIVLMYVSSVFRFILFDSVLRKRCDIGTSWRERQAPGFQLFLWTIAFTFLWLLSFAVFLGIPALMAFAAGWFSQPKEHLGPLVLFGILGLCVGLLLAVLGALVHVFTKDFIVPQMAIEGIGPLEAWRRLLNMINAEKGGYAGYVGLKVLLAIAAGIIFGIVGAIVVIIFILPVGGIGAIAVLAGKAAGVTWNLYTITTAVVAGLGALFAMFYLLSLTSVPAIVFFPAYSIYFFASRYPALRAVLYPANAPPLPPPVAPAWTPPPEPIG